jgi:hypothetical protein
LKFREAIFYILYTKVQIYPEWWLEHDSFFDELHRIEKLEARARLIENTLKSIKTIEQQIEEETRFIEQNK